MVNENVGGAEMIIYPLQGNETLAMYLGYRN
jgi:hypothetical protein